MLKIALATALFGVVHSALAGLPAKGWAVEHFGPRIADGLYRPFFLAQSLLLFGALVLYVRRQPNGELYQAPRPLSWLLRAGQAAAVALLVLAVVHAGLNQLLGADSFAAWARGASEVPAMPDGQGPAPAGDGTMSATGPFAFTRHPLNWLLLPLLWLNPRMTTRLLAFNLVVTLYVVLGSVHLEQHLLATYDGAYRLYQEHVPFFLGLPPP